MKRFLIGTGLFLALFLLCTCSVGIGPIQLAANLIGGWAPYLFRVIPEVSINWSGVGTAIVCLVGLAWGLHRFLGWATCPSSKPVGHEPEAKQRWPLRWTLCLLSLILLMFVAGVAAVGISHQTAWLVTSPEPLFRGGMRLTTNSDYSRSSLKQIGVAVHTYHDVNKRLPYGGTFDVQGRMQHGWQTFLLPYIEQDRLYGSIDLTIPWNHPKNAASFTQRVGTYLRPGIEEENDEKGNALSHYAANVRVLGGDRRRTFESITDGLAYTLLAGEAAGHYKPWGHPTNWRDPALGLNRSPDGFGSPDRKEVNFLFADGSARRLSINTDPAILKALSTPDGGEKVNLPE